MKLSKIIFSWPLLLLIRMYWYLGNRQKNRCLFKVTCSRWVYQVTLEKGIISGMKCLFKRYKSCRSNYRITENSDNLEGIKASDGVFYQKDVLADWLVSEIVKKI